MREREFSREREPCFGGDCITWTWNNCLRCGGIFCALVLVFALVATIVLLFAGLQMPGLKEYKWAPFISLAALLMLVTLILCCGTMLCMCLCGKGQKKLPQSPASDYYY